MSLKVVKFDTKMYLNFSNFRGRTSAGGGDKPWSKNRDKWWMGGIGKIFARWGDPPQSSPGKNPASFHVFGEMKTLFSVAYQLNMYFVILIDAVHSPGLKYLTASLLLLLQIQK